MTARAETFHRGLSVSADNVSLANLINGCVLAATNHLSRKNLKVPIDAARAFRRDR